MTPSVRQPLVLVPVPDGVLLPMTEAKVRVI